MARVVLAVLVALLAQVRHRAILFGILIELFLNYRVNISEGGFSYSSTAVSKTLHFYVFRLIARLRMTPTCHTTNRK